MLDLESLLLTQGKTFVVHELWHPVIFVPDCRTREKKKSEEFGCALYPCHWVDFTYRTDKEDSMRKVGSRNRSSDGRIKVGLSDGRISYQISQSSVGSDKG